MARIWYAECCGSPRIWSALIGLLRNLATQAVATAMRRAASSLFHFHACLRWSPMTHLALSQHPFPAHTSLDSACLSVLPSVYLYWHAPAFLLSSLGTFILDRIPRIGWALLAVSYLSRVYRMIAPKFPSSSFPSHSQGIWGFCVAARISI